jgi:hypothetical protein
MAKRKKGALPAARQTRAGKRRTRALNPTVNGVAFRLPNGEIWVGTLDLVNGVLEGHRTADGRDVQASWNEWYKTVDEAYQANKGDAAVIVPAEGFRAAEAAFADTMRMRFEIERKSGRQRTRRKRSKRTD